eukprot:598475-Prorocentrum_minimum.AAC.5
MPPPPGVCAPTPDPRQPYCLAPQGTSRLRMRRGAFLVLSRTSATHYGYGTPQKRRSVAHLTETLKNVDVFLAASSAAGRSLASRAVITSALLLRTGGTAVFLAATAINTSSSRRFRPRNKAGWARTESDLPCCLDGITLRRTRIETPISPFESRLAKKELSDPPYLCNMPGVPP